MAADVRLGAGHAARVTFRALPANSGRRSGCRSSGLRELALATCASVRVRFHPDAHRAAPTRPLCRRAYGAGARKRPLPAAHVAYGPASRDSQVGLRDVSPSAASRQYLGGSSRRWACRCSAGVSPTGQTTRGAWRWRWSARALGKDAEPARGRLAVAERNVPHDLTRPEIDDLERVSMACQTRGPARGAAEIACRTRPALRHMRYNGAQWSGRHGHPGFVSSCEPLKCEPGRARTGPAGFGIWRIG